MQKEKKLLPNRKGFTLVEIIGVVIILGIIAIIAIPYFTRSMETFREDYYVNMVSNIETSGREFFQDNAKYLPSKYLNSSKVTINTLIRQNYIDDILDYEGNNCDLESYVIVIRKAQDEYSYTVCMKCPDDDYDNTKEKECDKAWEDNSEGTILVGLGEPGNKYIYKDSTREEVIEKLKISTSIIKKNYADEVIGEVSGEGEEEVAEILPSNIDTIDTSKVGSYTTEYEYEGSKKEGTATVYENSEPNITIKKENIVRRNTVTTNTTKEVTNYNGTGEWGQKLIISFTASEEDNRVYKASSTKVSKYQWRRGDRWLDFCTADGNNNCTREIEEEMNETVYFRSVDNEGNISRVSKGYIIRIDNTKPTCALTINGTMGNNNWYISNVTVSFAETKDILKTSNEAISGVRTKGVTLSAIGTAETAVQSTDAKSVTWYGYVEDYAENSNLCEITFKRDATGPYASWSSNVGQDGDGSYHSNAGITVTGTCRDATSGVVPGSLSQTAYIPSPSNPGSASISCKDNAGNSSTPYGSFYVQYYSEDSVCGCSNYERYCAGYSSETVWECEYGGEFSSFNACHSSCHSGGDTMSGCTSNTTTSCSGYAYRCTGYHSCWHY